MRWRARQPPPDVPGGVTASSDVAAHVLVSWQPVSGAVGYHVWRDGARITSGPIAATSYQDAGAPAPVGSWQAPANVTATTDDVAKVVVGWTAPTRPLGASASYRVQAVNAAGDGPQSAEATGRRAAPALTGYEVEVAPSGGSATWVTTGSTAAGWTHVDPPKATIGTGTIAASQGDHRGWVRLTASGGALSQAASVSYRVRGALAGGGTTPTSAAVTGRRASGPLVRQWQRSAGEGASGFADLAGATGASFDDATAPSDGAKRHYRLQLTAAGADPATLGPEEGWRLAFVQVAGGGGHTCALTRHGRVWCWGYNDAGQLGRGYSLDEVEAPGRVPGLNGIAELSSGGQRACARDGSGLVMCWGASSVGDGTNFDRVEPVEVLASVSSLAIGASLACAVQENGNARCWGSPPVGDGTSEYRLTPSLVRLSSGVPLNGVSEVAIGSAHACAARLGGSVWCWGSSNGYGQTGAPLAGQSLSAAEAALVQDATAVAAGSFHTCSLVANGAVECWGRATLGRLGDGGASPGGHEPTSVIGISAAVQLKAASASTCARLVGGSVSCWGSNATGGLGDGTSVEYAAAPVTVSLGTEPATDLAAGGSHHCVVQAHTVSCWGNNSLGQLGRDTSPDYYAPLPGEVSFP